MIEIKSSLLILSYGLWKFLYDLETYQRGESVNKNLDCCSSTKCVTCLCVCVVGRLDSPHNGQWNSSREVQLGGIWSPKYCVARQRVAIIIPFRDRGEHLATLLPVLHVMLQRQHLHYTVYVVEQVNSDRVYCFRCL